MARRRFLAAAGLAAVAVAVLPGQAGARGLDGCRPVRAVFYAATGSLGLAQALAASASPCAQYLVSVPPLTADKTQMRPGTAGPIRALGPSFHALAEVNVTAWGSWVASTGNSWYAAGVEARRRMAAAGFDTAAGDTWAVNELSSAVRVGTGASRQNTRDLVHGLYDGDGGPPVKGVVFVTGIGQPIASVDTYKARLEAWLQDGAFWGDMSAYVSDFLQESYGDVRDYAVGGADVPTRLAFLNAYLEHGATLARVGPASAAPAAGYLAASYAPLANAAWAWTTGFGFTSVPSTVMQDYVTAQVAAMRSYSASLGSAVDRIGLAWDPSNTLGLSASDFNAQSAALEGRLAAAIAATDACAAPWCTSAVDGAAFTPVWGTFGSWTPTTTAFVSVPQTATAGSASGAMSVQLQIGPVATPLPSDTTVVLTSSSPGGSFATSASGPWSTALALTVPAGAAGATFFMLDSQAGTPTVTATLDGRSTSQVEVVNTPAAPLVLANGGNTVTYARGGAAVAVDPALAVSGAGATLSSATATITAGLDAGDVLGATVPGGLAVSYAGGVLTLSGTAPLATYAAALDSVTFTGTTSTGGTRSVLWTVTDGVNTASAVSTVTYTAPPGAPAGVTAAAGNGQAVVTFGAPASDGGTPVTAYTVTATPGGATATGADSPVTVGGLTNGVAYSFTVTATNGAGTGASSTASNTVVPAAGSAGGGGGGSSASAPLTPPAGVAATGAGAGASAPAATHPGARTPAPVKLTLFATGPVQLGGKRPAIGLTLRVARTSHLTVTLTDVLGRKLASWHRALRPGLNRLSLPLAPANRHAGARKLRLAWTGGRTKTVPLTLRAPKPQHA